MDVIHNPFGSIKVFIREELTVRELKQVRFPRSKKKRIRKKWSKRRKNFSIISQPFAFLAEGNIYANASGLKMLDKQIRQWNAKHS